MFAFQQFLNNDAKIFGKFNELSKFPYIILVSNLMKYEKNM